MNVYIIIPFHNEEKYIESTIKSIVEQSHPVKKLLLVNDNSTDQSSSKTDNYLKKYDWISKLDINSNNKHLPGKKVINAFNQGLNTMDSNYDIICKFDADIILPKNYLEKIVLEYKKDPLVGMASGILYIKKNDNWIFENISSKKHVRGPIKSYKKECFKEIGGLKESIGWDTVDVLLAKYNKWKVVTNENLIVKHKHLIIRAETGKTPSDPKWLHSWLVQLVSDIKMDICQGPITAYVDVPGNKGLTGVVIIETSHIAVHIWDEINPGLLQMDVYSCADFDPQQIFDKIDEAFEPVKLEYKFLDREKSLTTIESKNKR